MDLFSGNTLIDIDVYYSIDKNKAGYALITVLTEQKAMLLKAEEKTKEKVKVLKTKWRPQSWQAANELLQKATVFNFQKNVSEVNWTAYRDARLKSCLVEWDAKDDKGNPVPCVEQNINKLHASVALAMLEKYDEATTADVEEISKN